MWLFRCQLSLLPFLILWSGAVAAEAPAGSGASVYIEFLWSRSLDDALARQETRSFVLDSSFDHRVCIAVLGQSVEAVRGLVLEAVDTNGVVVSRQEYPDFDGSKRCYSAELPEDGVAGKWAYLAFLNGSTVAAGRREVEVARTLESAPFYQPSSVPYVLGRPNYDRTIPPGEFKGRLVWVMHVNAEGRVTDVDIEVSEGIGDRMASRALAAGYSSLFPPDPSRGEVGILVRRTLDFAPD